MIRVVSPGFFVLVAIAATLRFAALPTAAVFVIVQAAGCTTAYTATAAALVSAERVVNAAAEQFPELDRQKRMAIKDAAKTYEAGLVALAEWDITADKIVKAIQGADASVRLAADGLKGVRSGLREPKQLSSWIGPALRVGLDLVKLLKSVGLELKGVPL